MAIGLDPGEPEDFEPEVSPQPLERASAVTPGAMDRVEVGEPTPWQRLGMSEAQWFAFQVAVAGQARPNGALPVRVLPAPSDEVHIAPAPTITPAPPILTAPPPTPEPSQPLSVTPEAPEAIYTPPSVTPALASCLTIGQATVCFADPCTESPETLLLSATPLGGLEPGAPAFVFDRGICLVQDPRLDRVIVLLTNPAGQFLHASVEFHPPRGDAYCHYAHPLDPAAKGLFGCSTRSPYYDLKVGNIAAPHLATWGGTSITWVEKTLPLWRQMPLKMTQLSSWYRQEILLINLAKEPQDIVVDLQMSARQTVSAGAGPIGPQVSSALHGPAWLGKFQNDLTGLPDRTPRKLFTLSLQPQERLSIGQAEVNVTYTLGNGAALASKAVFRINLLPLSSFAPGKAPPVIPIPRE